MKKCLPLLLGLAIFLMAKPSGAQVPLSLDTTFRCTRFFSGSLGDNLPLADGSIIATAYYAQLDNCCLDPPGFWFRILPNGDIDETWPVAGASGYIHPFGAYYYLSGMYLPGRAFQANGETDFSFSLGWNQLPPYLNHGNNGKIFVQADGKVLFTGDHHIAEQWGPNAPGYYSLLRVNMDGVLDSTYHYRKTDGVIWTIEPTTEDRFLISGVYNTYEGLPEGRILRIWPDGSLDSTFHTDIIKGYAYYFVQQANGRIIAGGQFVYPNEPDTLHLIRLMPDGTLDPSFNNHVEFKGRPGSFGDFGFSVYDMHQLEDGTLIVGGDFDHIDGQLRRGIALLDSTGHLLNTAFTGEGCGLWHDINSTSMYSGISGISAAPDGSIFLTGFFRGFDDGTVSDTSMTMIVKLHGQNVGIHETRLPEWEVRVWPNPGSEVLHIEANVKDPMDVQVRDATGRTVLAASGTGGSLALSSASLSSGLYWVEVHTTEGRRTAKWVKQ